MQNQPSRKLFVNLAVHDLATSVEFFTKLGFTFNPKYTDESMACMVLSDQAFVMLLVESRFGDFARKPVADASKATEAIYALEVGSRMEVDAFVNQAFAAGAARAAEPMEESFMYGRSFYDLDGHHWEVFHMDESAMSQ